MYSLKRLAKWGVFSTVLASLASLSLIDHEASAHDACSAPAGQMCIAVDNQTKSIHSWRNPDSNNQCLPNSNPGTTMYYQSMVAAGDGPFLLAFSDSACGNPVNPGHGYGSRTFSTEGNYLVIHVSD
ncbi:MAG: hypothetical protein JO362_06730 [Streptomycetaceae bacterium]|nr:hypothetical protein [Streptomycetaceae bacterium]